MPELSAKSFTLQASPIRKLAPHARAAEARGTKVIYLNLGQPDMPTPPEMIAELHGLSLATLAYAPSEGLAAAREAWSAFFSSWDIDFALDMRKGDSFKLLYEEIYRNGEKIKDGEILAAELAELFGGEEYEQDVERQIEAGEHARRFHDRGDTRGVVVRAGCGKGAPVGRPLDIARSQPDRVEV